MSISIFRRDVVGSHPVDRPATIPNSNTTITPPSDHGASDYVVLVIMMLVMVTAVTGNACNLMVVLKTPYLRYMLSNFFVLSLCTGDLLAAISVLPMAAATFWLGRWPPTAAGCQVVGFATSLLIFLSTTTLSVISAERFYSIRLPMHHAANMTLSKTVAALVLVWSWAIVIASLPLFGLGSYRYYRPRYHCSFAWHDEEIHQYAFISVAIVLCFFLPLVILLITNLGIFMVAKKAALQVRPSFSPSTIVLGTVQPSAEPSDATRNHANQKATDTTAGSSNKQGPRQRSVVFDTANITITDTSDIANGSTPQEVIERDNDSSRRSSKPPGRVSKSGLQVQDKTRLSPLPITETTEDSGIGLHPTEEVSPSRNEVTELRSSNSLQKSSGMVHLRAAKTLVVVLGSYVVFWGPYFTVHLHGLTQKYTEISDPVEVAVLWLGFTSFAVNPFLYGWMNKAIRKELVSFCKSACCCWPCCPARQEQQSVIEEGPSDEDFMQFLERTSLAPSNQSIRWTGQSPDGDRHSRPDISDASGPF